ncbi:MAG: photosystem II protein PsbQ [Cyanobacteria bacterium J06632_22]
MKKWYRSLMAIVLVAIATLSVSCGGSTVQAPPTYTPEKIAQIQIYAGRLTKSQERLPELLSYIDKENWANIDNFIHGPLGELRTQMLRLSGQLLEAEKQQVVALADDIAADLEGMSVAVEEFNQSQAYATFDAFEGDFAALIDVIPTEPDTAS